MHTVVREAHLQVKSAKDWRSRAILDVEIPRKCTQLLLLHDNYTTSTNTATTTATRCYKYTTLGYNYTTNIDRVSNQPSQQLRVSN